MDSITREVMEESTPFSFFFIKFLSCTEETIKKIEKNIKETNYFDHQRRLQQNLIGLYALRCSEAKAPEIVESLHKVLDSFNGLEYEITCSSTKKISKDRITTY